MSGRWAELRAEETSDWSLLCDLIMGHQVTVRREKLCEPSVAAADTVPMLVPSGPARLPGRNLPSSVFVYFLFLPSQVKSDPDLFSWGLRVFVLLRLLSLILGSSRTASWGPLNAS